MKLLSRSTRTHLVFATIILLVAIPVFYLVIQRIVLEDVDESLVAEKHDLFKYLQSDSTIRQIPLNGLVEIIPVEKTQTGKPDTLFTQVIYDSFSREDIPYRVLQSYIDMHGLPTLVSLKRSLIDGEDLIQSIIFVVFALLVIIIVGMIIISRMSSKRLWTPFYTTLQKLRSFEIEKNSSVPLPVTKTDEFNDLHRSINTLIARTHEAYQSQKVFTENASHEMQTPLAVFRGKMELLMQTQPISAEQAALISDMEDANRRISYLNKNLLLLTRIENHQYYEKQHISIDATLYRIVDLYTPHASQKQINMQLNIAKNVFVNANASLIDILLSNLISNAIRHNLEGGFLEISLTEKGIFSIRNSGTQTALNSSLLFKRFQKQSTNSDSLGLGLAICQKICEINEYELTYSFGGGLHTFKLQFDPKK